jgi:hypothetical protein
MIKASEVIDNPNNGGYAGLSPPKLTPRGRRHVSFHDETNRSRAPQARDIDLQRTVSHDEEHHHQQQPALHPRVSSPTNEMLQPSGCAPETPDLENHREPMIIVSAGSHHGHHEAQQQVSLLPKRNMDHLFIPRALS